MKQNQVRLFENNILEALFKNYPIFQCVMWLAAGGWFIRETFVSTDLNWLEIVGCAIASFLVWPAIEYFAHRYVYHLPLQGKLPERLQYVMHGHHHDHPRDLNRVFAPLAVAIAFGVIGNIVTRMIAGPVLVFPLSAFSCFAYVIYEIWHDALHRYNFKNRVFRDFKRFHMMHHYGDVTTNYGVTATAFDSLCLTVYGRKRQPTKSAVILASVLKKSA